MKKYNIFNRNPTTPSHKVGYCSLANARSGRISENANIPHHSTCHQLKPGGIFAFKNKKADMPDWLVDLLIILAVGVVVLGIIIAARAGMFDSIVSIFARW